MGRPLCYSAVAMAVVIGISLFPASLLAQSLWQDRSHDKTIALEILKPNFDGEDNTTFATSALFLSVHYPIAGRLLFVAELPFAHYDFDSNFGDFEAQNTIGNP